MKKLLASLPVLALARLGGFAPAEREARVVFRTIPPKL